MAQAIAPVIARAMASVMACAMRLPMAEGIGASNGQAKPLKDYLQVGAYLEVSYG